MRNKFAKVSDPDSFVSDPGSPIHDLYESRFDGSSLRLVKCGRENIQDKIESFGPFTDLNYMLSRLKIGDSSVLSMHSPLYGDFSQFPKNPVDAINMVRNAESRFLSLSSEERQQFNNDWRVWLSSVLLGSGFADQTGAAPDETGAATDQTGADSE